MLPLISVVCPVYNVEQYLCQTLDSICSQTYENLQIICVDDGSTDSSLNILHRYSDLDKRIEVLSVKHQGASACRNIGLNRVRGEYVAILDSDDVYENNMFMECISIVQKDNSDIVVYRADQFEQWGNFKSMTWSIKTDFLPKMSPFTMKSCPERALFSLIGWSWDKLYKREFLEKNLLSFQNLPVFNDLRFGMGANLIAERISILDKVLAHHRIHSASVSKSNINQIECIFEALEALKKLLIEKKLFKVYERGFLNYYVRMLAFVVDKLNPEDKVRMEEMIRVRIMKESLFFGRRRDFWFMINEYEKIRKILVNDSFVNCVRIKLKGGF